MLEDLDCAVQVCRVAGAIESRAQSTPQVGPASGAFGALWCSGSNFLLPIVGLRRFAAAEADRLSVALSAVFLAVGMSRGVLGETFTIYASREDRTSVPRTRQQMLGIAIYVGAVVGVLLGLTTWLYLDAPLLAPVVGLGAMFVILQDACRYVMFEASRAKSAASSSRRHSH